MPQFNYNLSVENKLFTNLGLDFLLISDEDRRNELKKNAHIHTAPPLKNLPKEGNFAQKNNQTQMSKSGQNDSRTIIFNDKAPIKEVVSNLQSSARSSQEAKEMEENATQNPLYAKILPEFEWPEEWRNLYKTFYRAQSKVAWTYTGFSADLNKSEKLDPKRQEVIKRIIPKLDRPNGTHIFIPYDGIDEPGKILMHDDYSFYWSAIKQLKIRYLLIFGSFARDALHLPQKNKYSSFIFHGLRVNILPDINNIQADEEHSLYTFLDGQLNSVGIYKKTH